MRRHTVSSIVGSCPEMTENASETLHPDGTSSRRKSVLLSCLAALVVLFAANARYVYSDALDQLPQLTATHIADPGFTGSTFRFEGVVNDVGSLRSGLLIIKLYNAEEDVHVDAAVFPSVGCLPVKPVPGESVRITGNLGMYRGRPQITPLSALHVKVISSDDVAVSLSDAVSMERAGGTLRIGPLTATAVEPFTSRRGLKHVRLMFADPKSGAHGTRITAQGIMFQGDRTRCEVNLLGSGAPVMVVAKVDRYRGRPSLVVKRVSVEN